MNAKTVEILTDAIMSFFRKVHYGLCFAVAWIVVLGGLAWACLLFYLLGLFVYGFVVHGVFAVPVN